MILKASQRGGGQDLAVHLMRTDDNEHVRLHELRGFASDDLRDAFKEADAISRGTKCRQYLFSLSLSPPEQERVPVEVFEQAIERIETRLGLEGQPRAVVFHEKEGRRHAHCVWSRIDADTMTAKQMSFFKKKLIDVSRDLYLEHGWKMPRGIADSINRDPTNFSLAEWQQAKRQGVDPRWIKQTLQECWAASDNARAFGQSLQERGFFLAKGDKRSFVVLDHTGEVHSLPRALGLKTKEVAARLGDGADLAGVEATQKKIGERLSPAMRRHVAEARERFEGRSAALGKQKEEMTRQHRMARERLDQRQKQEWQAEARQRADRLPKGIRGLWQRITGKYQELRAQAELEAQRSRNRQAQERQKLIEQQLEQRGHLQAQFKALRKNQAQQLLELRRDVGRYLKFTRGQSSEISQKRERSIGLRLER
ncbi:relaxase/mobilization nuclease domain-containing protein [Belnapia rosea]|uniref:MobA/VirD2-like nuclease domain-containing protein n=1 Tax=Belnapia rosea TaxID=938405 RepID=A0A1G6SZD6_9PROT|nr:relaxase/mobilization nuclease domain-containing protein [Belnapia rosea]SDD21577.1 hypothetical protein SAMN04487779_1005204 [Belnapia rosea]